MMITNVNPETVDYTRYADALEQCVIDGNWLFNQSELDVWFDIDGFTVKVPAGTRILCTGWDQIRHSVENMEQEEFYGCSAPVNRGGFKFRTGHKLYIYNDLIVFSPDTAQADGMYYGGPERTLEEHIALINTLKLDKATVIAEDLSFLPRCPSIKHLSIQHARGQTAELDFSPLYELPHLESLSIAAPNMGLTKGPAIRIDFSRLPQLRHIGVCTNDKYNYSMAPMLESLWISSSKRHTDMNNLSCSPHLKRIDLLCCSMKSLDGIEKYPLQVLNMSYLRGMENISALNNCAHTLRGLFIEACGKIKDFSCLYNLVNLEHLELTGRNHLPDLEFLRSMPKLKTFVFSMEVDSGDLTPCLDVPYASCNKMKRHYNLSEKDLPKFRNTAPFQLI